MSRRKISRLDVATADRMFPDRKKHWPPAYLPASGVAHFLQLDGVPLRDVVETRLEMKDREYLDIQRDFASDYSEWAKAGLAQFVEELKHSRSAVAKSLKRITNRRRLCAIEEICSVWGLQSPALAPAQDGISAPHVGSLPRSLSGSALEKNVPGATAVIRRSQGTYHFTPFASLQEYAALPIVAAHSPDSRVKFATFPQLRNCLFLEFDSCTPMKTLSLVTGDAIVFNQEFIQELAEYLKDRIAELGEDAVESVGPDGAPRYRPVLSTFTNGRLASLLNESGLLPTVVVATRLPKPLMRRRLQLPTPDSEVISPHFLTEFPCEQLDVVDALAKYKPALVLVEPHVDRDFTGELRGFHTVREVLMFGQIDSPAMGSFSFPMLTFGCVPGPHSYWVYNDSMHRISVARGQQSLPMDPPYVAQGYERVYLDDISQCMIHENDCSAFPNQSRCLSFRRSAPPSKSSAGLN